MKTIPGELIIDGKHHSAEQLLNLALSLVSPGKSDWEQALGNFLRQWLDENDTVEVMTSGSTGLPKPVFIGKQAMLTSALMTGAFVGLHEHQTALLCLRANYIAGMMMIVRAMTHRMNLVIVPPDSAPLVHLPANAGIDFAAMVPAQVYNSLKSAESKRKLESIGTLIVGGAPVSANLERLIEDLKGNIYATFGMTETITHIALRRINGPEHSDVYSVLQGIAIDTDDRGCLIASVPYLAEKKVITNDLVRIESPVTFRWLGRADHVINCGGIKLIPEEIEKKIGSLIETRFIITAQPDPKLGEIPVLVIEAPAPLSENEKEKLMALLQTQLTRVETPRRILQTQAFTETESGKIIRSGSSDKAR